MGVDEEGKERTWIPRRRRKEKETLKSDYGASHHAGQLGVNRSPAAIRGQELK
jgi:hypothetical protein